MKYCKLKVITKERRELIINNIELESAQKLLSEIRGNITIKCEFAYINPSEVVSAYITNISDIKTGSIEFKLRRMSV